MQRQGNVDAGRCDEQAESEQRRKHDVPGLSCESETF